MSKQILIINITRMGDLVQMSGLLARLRMEFPDASVDLVVDIKFAPVVSMLPGLRHIVTYDFHGLIDDTRAMVKDLIEVYRTMADWIKPLLEVGYDRIVNLTFDRRSALLASYISAPDLRGVVCAMDGTPIVKNQWMSYFTDCHAYRRFNRFNLVDIYALGGSGPGPADLLLLSVPRDAMEWAESFLHSNLPGVSNTIAVQVGASDAMKAWRPEYFGRTMALLSRETDMGFLLIGTAEEADAVEQALIAYRKAGGKTVWCNAVGRTNVMQLTALLTHARLLLTNDTGPMHLAVGVRTPVVDLSVGHVNFWETGPYGPGHWVIQPELLCAPCGFDRVCMHHACKDQVVCEDVAAVCRHVMRTGPLPARMGGIRVYESGIDADGLGTFTIRSGATDPQTEWYARFWRRFWYESFTGRSSAVEWPAGDPPDREDVSLMIRAFKPALAKLVSWSEQLDRLCQRQPLPVTEVKAVQAVLLKEQQELVASAMMNSPLIPVTVAFLREIHNNDAQDLTQMSARQLRAHHVWQKRVADVEQCIEMRPRMPASTQLITPVRHVAGVHHLRG
jgi:ADP-heptose:LPS heptosyltransferase